MPTKAEIEDRIEHFTEICRDAGVKLTHQRLVIFREVASTEEHPDAETVFRHVRKKIPTVSLDTVYRTLWLLNDLGLVSTIRTTGTSVRFDANIEAHHHFICTRCGLTHDFKCESLNAINIPDDVNKMGDVKATHVEFRGLCSRCSMQNRPKTTKRNNPRGGKHEG